jgi:hypothetical protein
LPIWIGLCFNITRSSLPSWNMKGWSRPTMFPNAPYARRCNGARLPSAIAVEKGSGGGTTAHGTRNLSDVQAQFA